MADRRRLHPQGRQVGGITTALLSPAEFDELYRAREQFRRAGYNLDALLRQVYLTQLGVTVRGPEADEFRAMLGELRQATAHYTAMLAKFP